MAELVPMLSILQTDYGEFVLSAPVGDKIAAYPKIKFVSPFADDDADPYDIVDFNHPTLARYERFVTNHMKKRWLAGEI